MSEEITGKEQTYKDIQAALTAAIWKDENLRNEIIKDPRNAIEKALGIHFKEGTTISVIDQTNPNSLTFVLPPHPQGQTGVEFTDEQLDAIAGGLDVYINIPVVTKATIINAPVAIVTTH